MARIVIFGPGWEELVEAAQFKARQLARLCQRSMRQLERDFRRHLGCSPQAWLNERRMQAARRQLLSGEAVKKVALDLGFKQVSYFCTRFKAVTRMTPTEFVLHNGANGAVGKTQSMAVKHN